MRTVSIAILAISVSLFAVETAPVEVVSVADGDTITVAGEIGGVRLPVRVRLLYVDTPELHGNAHGEAMPEGQAAADFLRAYIPIGSKVRLSSLEKETFNTDSYGRVLAEVIRDSDNTNANIELVRAGWSPYWRKYGEAPGKNGVNYTQAVAEAIRLDNGAWKTAKKWMLDKSNETTAPKR